MSGSITGFLALASLLFVVVATVSWFGVRHLIKMLSERGIVDEPNNRTMHQGAVPRGGGLVIVGFLLLGIIAAIFIGERPYLFSALGLLLFAWAALSWVDDKFGLSPFRRGLVQLILASVSVFLLGWVDRVMGWHLGFFGPVLSVFGIVWMANLNNFMDGMDGLAASQAIVASSTLGMWFYFLGDYELALVCLFTVAACYGFLLLNWHPAKIFMGDVGSITLGAFYGCMIIIAADRHEVPVLSLMLVFAVFVFDATYTVIRRVIKKEKFWLPHRSHWYQRAGLAGVPHKIVVLLSVCLMVLSSLFATISLLYRDIITEMIALTVLILAITAAVIVGIENKASQVNRKT